jgi:hypothetical protein
VSRPPTAKAVGCNKEIQTEKDMKRNDNRKKRRS